jgi:hypothetical protein
VKAQKTVSLDTAGLFRPDTAETHICAYGICFYFTIFGARAWVSSMQVDVCATAGFYGHVEIRNPSGAERHNFPVESVPGGQCRLQGWPVEKSVETGKWQATLWRESVPATAFNILTSAMIM